VSFHSDFVTSEPSPRKRPAHRLLSAVPRSPSSAHSTTYVCVCACISPIFDPPSYELLGEPTPTTPRRTRAVTVLILRDRRKLLLSYFVLHSSFFIFNPSSLHFGVSTRHQPVELRFRTSPGQCPSRESDTYVNGHQSSSNLIKAVG
jgi:hypothetical protein